MAQARLICTSCGHVGSPKTAVKGNLAIEIILWFFFIIPGLIYTIWRQGSYYKACPICKKDTLIPVETPNGKRLLEQSGRSIEDFKAEEKVSEEINKKNHNRKLILVGTLFGIWFLIWAVSSEHGGTRPSQPQAAYQPPMHLTQVTTTTPSPTKNISYEIVERWGIPNGARGQVIVISPSNVNEEDMIALGEKIKNETATDSNVIKLVFSDKKAAMLRTKIFDDVASANENAFYDRHFVGSYKKNMNTGYHAFVFALEGVNGPTKEITY